MFPIELYFTLIQFYMFQKRRAALLKNCLILLHQLYTMTCLLFDILLISKLLSRIFFFTCCLNNNLYQGKRQMSKQSVSQQLFLNVKERLDYYRLPTTFPIQSTTLLSKLLHLLDHSPHKNNIEFSPSKQSEGLSAALRHQMGRLVKENNKLHQDLMCNRQEIQSLQHRLFKFQSNKASDSKQSNHLSSLQLQRQQQLLAQLHQVRFKYNQLTDFIHQDPTFEREYIKRLMKHKPIGSSGIQESKMKGQSNVHMQRSQFSQDRVRQLEKKIKNRENEILRLQNLIQYDGLNMNKIIKNYQDSLTSNKLKIADDKVNYLEESMDKIKKENKYMRGTNGSKEALRAEVQKCHKLIQSLKKENNQLKRNHKEQAFDLQKHVAENERKITNVKADRHNAEKEAKRKEEQLQELVKKLSFTEKELKEARQSSKDYKGKLEQAEKSNFDFVKKSQEQKVFYEYEIDTYKKKLYDLDAQTADLRNGTKRALHQKDILRRQSEIKTDSIINLEKIVAELLKKNSILADNTLGTIQSMKRNEDFEMKRQIIDLQQQLIYSQNERQQADTDKKTLQHRFTLCLKENDRLKQEYGLFRKDLSSKQSSIMQLNNDIDDLRSINKRYQTEISKLTHQLRQSIGQKQRIQNQLKQELQASLKTEKNSKTKAKDLEIRLSEQQGMLQITKIKLQEREERIKQLQRLLTETVDQSKNLSAQLTQFQMKNQQLLRQNHKLAKKYDETVRQAEQFRNTSFRNYELSINDNNNQVNSLKKKIMMHTQSQERVKIRYEQLSNLLNMIRREKELLQAKSLNLQKQNERLEIRLSEMQEIQRVLVIENENLRNLARRL